MIAHIPWLLHNFKTCAFTAVGNNYSLFQKHFFLWGTRVHKVNCTYIKVLKVQPMEISLVLILTAVMTITELVMDNGMIKSFWIHVKKSG